MSDQPASIVAPDDGAEPTRDDGLQEAVLLPPRGLVATTLVAVAVTAAVAILWAPGVTTVTAPSLQLSTWQGDGRALHEMAARDEALLRQDLASASAARQQDENQLLAGWVQWLAQEATLGSLGAQHNADARLALGMLQEQARTFALRYGPRAWQALAVRYGRSVRAASEPLVVALPAGATWTSAPARQVAALEAIAPGWGTTLQHLRLQRFVDRGRLEPAAALLVEALAAQRILSLGARLPQPLALDSDRQGLVLRFRVEAHEGLGLQRKLALLSQLAASDPSYPSVYVRGVLLARDGDCPAAVQAWQQAVRMRQQAAQARANIAWCEAQSP